MRALLWTAVVWGLVGAGTARAEETPEPARAAESQVAPQAGTAAAEATPQAADAATPAEPAAAAAATKPEEAAPAPAEPVPAAGPEIAQPEKVPAAKPVVRGPFQGSWQEASPDEKALFLEAFGESSRAAAGSGQS